MNVDLDVFNGTEPELQNFVIPTVFTGIGGGPLQPPANGQFQMEVHSSEPQLTIQASSDLMEADWVDVATVNLANGTAIFTDTNAVSTIKFYRLKP
jgi:hypothetical protein